MEEARSELLKSRKAMNADYSTTMTTQTYTDQSPTTSTMTPEDARGLIERVHKAIRAQMLAAIPWPEIQKNRKRIRIEWPECIRLLEATRRLHKEQNT